MNCDLYKKYFHSLANVVSLQLNQYKFKLSFNNYQNILFIKSATTPFVWAKGCWVYEKFIWRLFFYAQRVSDTQIFHARRAPLEHIFVFFSCCCCFYHYCCCVVVVAWIAALEFGLARSKNTRYHNSQKQNCR